jgi:c-di-GMP phosphodiesterase
MEGGADRGSAVNSSFEWLCQAAQSAPAQSVPVEMATPVLWVGARCDADFDEAFKQGAHAVAGWPMDEDLQLASPATMPPELRGVLDLMNRVEREEPVARLEAVLTADPSLAYRLLRYLNTSAFGLRSEVSSFRHGLMMLGYQRLKRWLALLLVSGSQDPKSRMLMAVAARRGLILDQLASGLADEAMRGEMFICGVFSLLDRMLHLPMGELVRHVPMHERVQLSLNGQGPYSPHLALMGALEGGSAIDIRECAEAALVGRAELNRAVLKGLALSWELE